MGRRACCTGTRGAHAARDRISRSPGQGTATPHRTCHVQRARAAIVRSLQNELGITRAFGNTVVLVSECIGMRELATDEVIRQDPNERREQLGWLTERLGEV